MTRIHAYTDGGCRGNPGIGAWAFILIDTETGKALQRAGGERHTTNNRMEMMAAIETLRALREASPILIHSDSKYLIDCCSSWMAGWKRQGWKRKGGELKNVDLLKILDGLLVKHQVSWQWVKGHSGNAGNDHVDGLLNTVMDRIAKGEDSYRIDDRVIWQG
ncbi:MAG: ribonuclease HI [Planctomycetota bacterium]|nr:MAG: ribonuclease HI [Planctomycetota bacterium]